ncbi:MAG: hypothetical protein KIS81_02930 [Maricaulaceae bacterium]|nr:hypothetical protein [Maricaulaceae bacterium]
MYIYGEKRYVDRLRTELQLIWGEENFALMTLPGEIGSGPSVWCHGFKPDQHAFNNRGGWIFPMHNHAGEGAGHLLAPGLLAGLSKAYGGKVTAQDAFDAMLALLSAASYTTRFAHDLENEFPHVPFPADGAVFRDAAAIGARIRDLQGFRAAPDPAFRKARLDGKASGPVLDIPTPAQAWTGADGMGAVALLPDQSLRITGVSERVWRFNVSGYQALYRWLRARKGEALSGASGAALLKAALDVVWRIEELVDLFDRADEVLERALKTTLKRADFGLGPRGAAPAEDGGEDDDEPA